MAVTWPVPVWPTDASAEALDGQADQETALVHVPADASPASSPTLLVQTLRNEQRVFDILEELAALFVYDEGGLLVGVNPGHYTLGGTHKQFQGATAQAVFDNDVSYIYIDAANALQIVTDATDWPADKDTFVPLAEVTASGGDITAIVPVLNRGRIIVGGAAATQGTDADTFTIDQNNVGAGVDLKLLFNRGTTAGDASLFWDEANDKFLLRADDDVPTQARLDLLSLLIGGGELLKNVSGTLEVRDSADADYAPLKCKNLTITGTPSGFDLDQIGDGATRARVAKTDQIDVADGGITGTIKDTFKFSPGGDAVNIKYGAGGSGLSIEDDSANLLYLDVDQLLIKGTVAINNLGKYVSATLPKIDIPDASGTSPRTITLQVTDDFPTNLTGTFYFVVSVHDGIDGGANAATATISIGTNGTLISALTSGKELHCKTNASGQLDVQVTDATLESVFIIARPYQRSHRFDGSDVGTVTITA